MNIPGNLKGYNKGFIKCQTHLLKNDVLWIKKYYKIPTSDTSQKVSIQAILFKTQDFIDTKIFFIKNGIGKNDKNTFSLKINKLTLKTSRQYITRGKTSPYWKRRNTKIWTIQNWLLNIKIKAQNAISLSQIIRVAASLHHPYRKRCKSSSLVFEVYALFLSREVVKQLTAVA